ncbi:MAG: hypothetical protein JXR07_19325 [Reichenbachiella sp.]
MEKDRLKFSIGRFDHYYDSINNKSAVFLALGTFLIGGLITLYPLITPHLECDSLFSVLVMLSISIGLTSMIIVMTAATPYLSDGIKSKFYFNSIASTSKQVFDEESINLTEEDELSDLRSQVYAMAKGLKSKFQKIRIAGFLLIALFISLIPIVITISINIK